MLPDDQGREMWELWQEFEERKTPEALFAAALDRLQPMLNNAVTGGGTWTRHDIASSQVRKRGEPILQASPSLGSILRSYLKRPWQMGFCAMTKITEGK
jgi:putative hydrolases of HD superfamily